MLVGNDKKDYDRLEAEDRAGSELDEDVPMDLSEPPYVNKVSKSASNALIRSSHGVGVPDPKTSKPGEFVCKFCGKTLGHEKSFIQHVRLQHKCRCPYCDTTFPSSTSLCHHLKNKHGDYAIYSCRSTDDECSFMTRNRPLMVKHRKKHGDEWGPGWGLCVCKHCGQEFEFLGEIQNHYKDVHGENVKKFLYQKKSSKSKIIAEAAEDVDEPNAELPGNVLDLEVKEEREDQGEEKSWTLELSPVPQDLSVVKTEEGPGGQTECHLRTEIACNYCKKIFIGEANLIQHVRRKHKCRCPYCNETFTSSSSMLEHLDQYHGDYGLYRCRSTTDCQYKTRHRAAMISHRKSHGDQWGPGWGLLVCKQCGKEFECLSEIQSHLRHAHGQDVQQFIWKKKYRSDKLLAEAIGLPFAKARRELEEVSEEEGEGEENVNDKQCLHCGKEFTSEGDMDKHLFEDHTEYAVYNCPECPFQTRSELAMLRHKKKNHNLMSLNLCQCGECGAECESLREFQQHLIKRHERPDVLNWIRMHKAPRRIQKTSIAWGDKFPCDFCPAVFRLKTSYLQHFHRKHNLRCSCCAVMFGSNKDLQSHQSEAHGDYAVYKCRVCDYVTKARHIMLAHREQHEDKDWKLCRCSECGEEFDKIKELQRHLRSSHHKDTVAHSSADHQMKSSTSKRRKRTKETKERSLEEIEKDLSEEENEVSVNALSQRFFRSISLDLSYNFSGKRTKLK